MELVLDYVASSIGHENRMLASELDIESSAVDRLELEYPDNPHEQTFHILYKWNTTNRGTDHKQTLSEKFQSIRRVDIAQKLLEFTKNDYACDGVVEGSTALVKTDVEVVAEKLAGNNYRLGRFLGIPQSRISQIKMDNARSIMEQTYQMLDWCRKNLQPDATRQSLCDGLVYVGQIDVVNTLTKLWTETKENL